MLSNLHFSLPLAGALLALSAGVQAADIQIYGTIDTGLNFQHIDADRPDGGSVNRTRMNSSQTLPNRWGFRGSEALGSGFTAGFELEGQYQSDSGELMTGSRLFHRMAQVHLQSADYGKLVLGRSGALRSGTGSTGLWGPKLSPFSNSWGDYIVGSKYIMPGSFGAYDNTITYITPKFAGLQVHAQFSAQTNSVNAADDAEEFESSSDRAWAVAATYEAGPLYVVGILDGMLYADTDTTNYDNSFNAALAVAHQFNSFKLYASGMYFTNVKGSEFLGRSFDGFSSLATGASYKGYSLQIGADAPLWGGTAKVNIGWMDAAIANSYGMKVEDKDVDRIGIGAGYSYPLSKRTTAYIGAGWLKDSAYDGSSPSAIEGICGLSFRF